MLQSLYTRHMRRRKLKPLNWELIIKTHMEKFPTKHHVEVIWTLQCTQCLIGNELYQMMTWLYSIGILPVHKETTIQPFPLTPSTFEVYKKSNDVNNVLENTFSLVQSLPVCFIFSHSGSALSFVCKFTWPDIQQCIIDQTHYGNCTDWINQIKGRGKGK